MKTICEISTGVSHYLFDDGDALALMPDSILTGGFKIGHLNAGNAIVYDGVAAPDDWEGGKYCFDGLVWEIREKHEAKAAMLAWINAFLSRFTAGIAKNEPLFWDRKEALARTYIAGTATDDEKAIIEAEAGQTGEQPAELAAVIVGKGAVYSQVMALTTGLRRKTVAAIDAVDVSQDPEMMAAEIDAILAGAQTIAMAEAAKLNIA